MKRATAAAAMAALGALAAHAALPTKFVLTAKELGYWNRDVEYVVEPGDFMVAVWDRFTPSFATDRQVVYTVK